MSRSLLFLGAALASITALAPRSAEASLVIALELPQMVTRADRVVVADVVAVNAAWDERHERILTTITLQVGESWKGEVRAGQRLEVIQPGGTVGDMEMRVHGMPQFRVGERAVLFLRDRGDGKHLVVGLGQGKRGMRFDAASQAWLVEGGDRSAAVVRENGRLQPAAVDAALRLEDLRARVRSLLEKPEQGPGKPAPAGARP